MQLVYTKKSMDFFNIVYDYVFIFQLITVCASLIIIFYPFKRTWKSVLEIALQVIVLFCVGTLLNWGLFELSHVVVALRGINFPISWLLLILGYLFIYKTPLINRVLMGGTLFVTVYAVIIIGRQLMMLIPDNLYPSNINLVAYVFVILYSILLNKLSLKEYTDLPSISAALLLAITIFMSMLMIGKEAISANSGSFGFDLFLLFVAISCYAISICSYLMLYFYAKTKKSMVQLQVENKLLEADKERIENFENTRESFLQIRHDLRNQMNMVQIMLEKKQYDDLEKYLNSTYADLIHDLKYDFIDCDNPIINSVINMEILKAKRSNVELKISINVPDELPFEPTDISRILVNLIDNAIEAIVRRNEENKYVNCSILTHGEYVYIGVQNSISNDIDKKKILSLNTEKEDQTNHGIGHRIVKRIANKYNGHVNYSIENENFFAEVMLDIDYNKGDVK